MIRSIEVKEVFGTADGLRLFADFTILIFDFRRK